MLLVWWLCVIYCRVTAECPWVRHYVVYFGDTISSILICGLWFLRILCSDRWASLLILYYHTIVPWCDCTIIPNLPVYYHSNVLSCSCTILPMYSCSSATLEVGTTLRFWYKRWKSWRLSSSCMIFSCSLQWLRMIRGYFRLDELTSPTNNSIDANVCSSPERPRFARLLSRIEQCNQRMAKSKDQI